MKNKLSRKQITIKCHSERNEVERGISPPSVNIQGATTDG